MIRHRFSKDRLRELAQNLITYLRHPIREISRVPEWEWPELLLVQVIVTAATGAATGLVDRSILGIFSGIVLTPLLTLVTIAVSSLFFYYLFQLFFERTVSFRKLATVVFLSTLPFFIFHILSGFISVINLVGLAFTAVILVVGLVENFQVPRRFVVRVIVAVYFVIFAMWLWGRWESSQIEAAWRTDRFEAPEVKLGE